MVHLPVVSEQTTAGWKQIARHHFPAIAVIALASVVMTWPLVLHMSDSLLTWGDPVFQTWTIGWNWHALTTDPLRIFDTNIMYPWRNTLAFADHLFGQTALVLPVMAFTSNAVLADNISVLLAFFLTGLAMYLLAFDITGSRVAALVAGLAYAFAPSRMAHLEHLNVLSAQWPPLALLCLRRIVIPRPVRSSDAARLDPQPRGWRAVRPRWYVLLGLVFFLQGQFGIYYLYFTIVVLVIAASVWTSGAIRDRDASVVQRLLIAAGACAIAGALLVPTLLPYLQLSDDLHLVRERIEVQDWSAIPRDYLAVWDNDRLWNGLLASNHRHIEKDLFPGLLVVLLALAGLANRRAGRDRWLLLTLTVVPVLLSFGPILPISGHFIPMPYRLLYDYVPGFQAMRVAARMGVLALLGLAGLAACGVQQIGWLANAHLPRLRGYPARLRAIPWLPGALVGLALAGGVLLEGVTRIDLPGPLPVPGRDASSRPDYDWLRDHPAPTIELPMGDGPVASSWPNYWSLGHWNQVVNGYSGNITPTYLLLRDRMNEFPSADTIWLLQGIGVENVVVHSDDPTLRPRVDAALPTTPELTLAFDGPEAIFRLAPDPWMWRLAEAIPAGATVDLPHADADPLAFGLLLAILQRTGHDVTGNGTVGYYTFTPAAGPQCYAILPASDDPAAFGYGGAERVREDGGWVLWRSMGGSTE